MKISIVIVTKNEENWIENCLKSIISLANEIIVVDTGSTDKTVEICKRYKALIFKQDWHGFSKQKNFAISQAHGDWIFFIDADERASKELIAEISRLINSGEQKASAYQIPRQNILMGQKMKHGGWWPDPVTRLVRRDKIIGWEGDLHEDLKVDGEILSLTSPLYHLSHRGITWMLSKSIRYTEIEAKLRFDANHPKIVWWRFFRVMLGEFWFRLIVKKGFLDGTAGWIEAISQSYNMFLIYVHLWELQKGKTMDKIYEDLDKEMATNGF